MVPGLFLALHALRTLRCFGMLGTETRCLLQSRFACSPCSRHKGRDPLRPDPLLSGLVYPLLPGLVYAAHARMQTPHTHTLYAGTHCARTRTHTHAHAHPHAQVRTRLIVLIWGLSIVNTMRHGLFKFSGKVINSELSKMQVGTPCAPQPCLLDARALFGLRYGGNIVRGRFSPHAAPYSGRLLQVDC
jgi:hypothetical protein